MRWEDFKKFFFMAMKNADGPLSRVVVSASDRLAECYWSGIRAHVFIRDGFTCQYCNRSGVRLECDHIYPLSLGGGNDYDNLVTSCKRCNRSKGKKTLLEWRAK